MFGAFVRLLIVLTIIGAVIWFLAPRPASSAANSVVDAIDSAAHGLAQYVPANLTAQGKMGDLQIQVQNLVPGTAYELTLDLGQCGVFARDLGATTTDANGNFYVDFPIKTLQLAQKWFVNVHEQGVSGLSVACGQLQQSSQETTAQNNNPGPNIFNNLPPLQNGQDQGTSTPTPAATPTPGNTPTTGLPNTGAPPGTNQNYDNHTYPRKY